MPAAQSKLPQINCAGPCTWCSALQSCTNGRSHQRDQTLVTTRQTNTLPNSKGAQLDLGCGIVREPFEKHYKIQWVTCLHES